jgi:hypothetical protein
MEATSLALDHLLRAAGDPVAELRDIGPGHPEFERAQTLRAAAGVIAKSPDAFSAIARAIRIAGGAALSLRKRAHLAAAEAWLSGDPVLAAERYAAILASWPRDLLALRLAQSCYFFLGWHQRLCAVVDAVMPAWSRDEHGFGYVLAMASFAHAENGDAASAEALGREALTINPACPFGVHAVAHAIAESGRPRDGARWMREQHAHWAGESRMRTHNAWHLAMFDVEDGNFSSALGILDDWLLPAADESPIEACDAAGLLSRLADEGIDDAGRWLRISDAFERSLVPGFWPFVDLHAGLSHFAAGKRQRAQRLIEMVEHRAEGSDFAAMRAREITLPGLNALVAGAQPALGGTGGSRIQLEVFKSIGPERPSTKEQSKWKDKESTSDHAFAGQ